LVILIGRHKEFKFLPTPVVGRWLFGGAQHIIAGQPITPFGWINQLQRRSSWVISCPQFAVEVVWILGKSLGIGLEKAEDVDSPLPLFSDV
jgi:hypothetical protein